MKLRKRQQHNALPEMKPARPGAEADRAVFAAPVNGKLRPHPEGDLPKPVPNEPEGLVEEWSDEKLFAAVDAILNRERPDISAPEFSRPRDTAPAPADAAPEPESPASADLPAEPEAPEVPEVPERSAGKKCRKEVPGQSTGKDNPETERSMLPCHSFLSCSFCSFCS